MKHFIFDTETTDLTKPAIAPLKDQPHIIELYGMVLDDEHPDGIGFDLVEYTDQRHPFVQAYYSKSGTYHPALELVDGKPTGKIWEAREEYDSLFVHDKELNSDVRRITGLQLSDLIGKPKFRDEFPKIATMMEKCDRVVAHNLTFDMDVVNYEVERFEGSFKWPKRKICTVEATEHLKGHRLSLTALHTELFGSGFPSAHRARFDVYALARCYIELLKRKLV